MNSGSTRLCPMCKEEIKNEAIKCKHCGSSVTPAKPDHGGICPYCKEIIHKEAIKCKHCQTMLISQPYVNYGSGEIEPTSEQEPIAWMAAPVRQISTGISSQPRNVQQSTKFIFCRQRCIEWNKLFPNICNISVWDCSIGPVIMGPVIIIWGPFASEVRKT